MARIMVSTHDPMYPIIGGGALRTVLSAKEFKKRGNEVIIVGPAKTDKIDGMKVYNIPAPRKERSAILSTIKFNIRLFYRVLVIIENCDMIFLHNTISAPVILLLAKLYRKKFILDVTDLHAEYLKVGNINMLERFAKPYLLWMEYLMINMADKVIAVTETMKQRMVSMGVRADKISVIYDGAQLDKFSTVKEDTEYKNVIHLGSVDKQHGVELFIESIPLVLKEYSNVKFYIIGGGRELPNIINKAKELKVENACIFTDYVPHEEAKKYLNKASIGIIPRPDSLPNHMVVTLKLLEYWASGTAVVASRLKGVEEIARDKDNIMFFKPGDKHDLAEKVVHLLKNPDDIRRLHDNCLETVKKYSWDKIIPQIADLSLG